MASTVVQVRRVDPKGYYFAHEAGRLAGVSGDRIGQWARRGYIRSSISTGRPRIYSFQDVAEAMIVHELVDEGVLGDWPLSNAPIVSSSTGHGASKGASLMFERGDSFTALRRNKEQGVLTVGHLRRIADDLRHGGWAARELGDLRWIEVDPDRLSGRPTVRGTRVPAELVARLAETEDGRETLRADYGIRGRQIEDAKRWWRRVEGYAQAA
jgi:uncharacterized protein (DUF433 family)